MVSFKALALSLLPLAAVVTCQSIPTEYGDDYCDEEPSSSSSSRTSSSTSASSSATSETSTTPSSSSSTKTLSLSTSSTSTLTTLFTTTSSSSFSSSSSTTIIITTSNPTTTTGSTSSGTSTSSSSSASPSTSSAPLSGRGYFYGYDSDGQRGCLITAGTWYAGTCAYYTPTPVSGSMGGFTMNTSKGPCTMMSDSSLNCAAGNTPSTFTAINGYLAYAGSTAFYAAATPNPAQTVYATANTVPVMFQWQQASS